MSLTPPAPNSANPLIVPEEDPKVEAEALERPREQERDVNHIDTHDPSDDSSDDDFPVWDQGSYRGRPAGPVAGDRKNDRKATMSTTTTRTATGSTSNDGDKKKADADGGKGSSKATSNTSSAK